MYVLLLEHLAMDNHSVPTMGRTRRHRRSLSGGFTLVELLAVIAIITLVAGLIIGITGRAAGEADEARARTKIENITRALEEYRLENGAYLDSGVNTNMDHSVFEVLTNYVEGVDTDFLDPWGKPYSYRLLSKFRYELVSGGKDGKFGAEYDYDNVSNQKDL